MSSRSMTTRISESGEFLSTNTSRACRWQKNVSHLAQRNWGEVLVAWVRQYLLKHERLDGLVVLLVGLMHAQGVLHEVEQAGQQARVVFEVVEVVGQPLAHDVEHAQLQERQVLVVEEVRRSRTR